MSGAGPLRLRWRSFRWALPQPLLTARGRIVDKAGWLLRLEAADGTLAWGEASVLGGDTAVLGDAIGALGPSCTRAELEHRLAAGSLPGPLSFALGAALAELQGLPPRRWLPEPPSAQLLPAGAAMLPALRQKLARPRPAGVACSWKWKVAVHDDALELDLLGQLLAQLPARDRLRLDANGGWDRATAARWAERLRAEPRLEWLEQPLPVNDPDGLAQLQRCLPVALDESLPCEARPLQGWRGWQVRRPSQQGDPRPLLAALEAGQPRLMLSTAFETGIGRRWLAHLAALQLAGPTPAAPGLAPAWQPLGALASADPHQVWAAAA